MKDTAAPVLLSSGGRLELFACTGLTMACHNSGVPGVVVLPLVLHRSYHPLISLWPARALVFQV
jgi:hypothetical protein